MPIPRTTVSTAPVACRSPVVYAQRIDRSGGYGVPVSFVREALDAAGPEPVQTECVER